jgi:hypothetical protein
MKAVAAAVSALALAGCATFPPPPGYSPLYAHHRPSRVYYASPAYPAPGPYPAYPMPGPLPPAQQAPPPPGVYPVPGTPQTPQRDPYNPYTQEQMATGIAEALGLAALLSTGLGATSTGSGGTFTGGGGGLPDFTLHGEPPPYADLQ